MSSTPLSYFVTKVKAEVIVRREESLKLYELFPDTTMYWCFIDLVHSSNFRLANGPREGYVRGEAFYTLVNTALAPYSEIRRVKELGDGVLLASPNLRPLFETCILVGQTARELSEVAGTDAFPFAVRMAIGFGPCKRLSGRPSDDFLGSPIDTLSRLSGAAAPNELLIADPAYESNQSLLAEYRDFASIEGPKRLSSEQSKHLVEPVDYRRVLIDRPSLAVHEGDFSPWRTNALGGA